MQPQDLEASSSAPTEITSASSTAQASDDSIKKIVDEARSIQALLRDYQQRNESLKGVLSGFVHREIDEHAKLLHLRAAVDQAELAALRNSQYMEYVSKHAKQEQPHVFSAASSPDVSANAASAHREQSSPHCVTGSTSKSKVWWVEKLEKADSAKFRGWLPDSVLALNGEESVTHVWLGWKNATSASEEAFTKVVDRVYSCSNTHPSTAEAAFSCFGNGFLCTTPAEVDANVFASLEKKVSFIVTAADNFAYSENDESAFDSLTRRIAWMTSLYNTELYDAVAMSRACFVDNMWPKHVAGAANATYNATVADGLRLCGDDRDTLVFVNPERLRTTITIRGFFFHGDVGLVEQLGAEVDMTALFLSTDHHFRANEECRTWARSSIVRTLRALYAALSAQTSESGKVVDASATTNLVLTVALNLPPSKNGLFDGVLLDARPISPQLPFEGRTTWMEVCAVGRQKDGVCTTVEDSKNAEKQNAPHDVFDENVVFRLAYLPVAFVQPYDAISQRIFPLLNEASKSRLGGSAGATGSSGDKRHKVSALRSLPATFVTMASLCVGTASCVALAVGVLRWLWRP
ncbi:hypothetical protein ABB37_07960 [Leptomonas pyrrhocoris]|uniref:Transmembrane protein n=1 Tax=Leptomonas pyrrhocoris TaxID=157538 RepID=A0A0M9FUH4_LEPPY|nr:hypothetical protein ABB37_07960 [Leptomonas pyrrhocoris]KPA76209.1 hypothetical protein ABB37_07960 [Leptomonas pyrrhocoris]|eukprot:XP_015654648.1 hypothetical protein ABB37_07960 [Leptomonas pyrrhocoris]